MREKRGGIMRLLGIDFETTGLDTANDRIVEMGAVLWDTDTKKPLKVYNEFLFIPGIEISPEAQKVNGISNEMLKEFGQSPEVVFMELEHIVLANRVEYLVAHNAENFDKAILMSELDRFGLITARLRSTPWIDTRQDIPYEIEPTSRKLNHLAADMGFVNPFQHRAVFDVLTMLRVLSQYDIEQVLEYQRTPFVTLQALVSYDERQLAKDARFSWQNIGTKVYKNCWVKRVKKNLVDIERERLKAKFQLRILED